MSDIVSRFDGSTLTGALSREAAALNNTAKATNDTAHNLAAEQTIAGRPRNTFQDVYYSHMGGEAAGYIENDVRYYIRGAGAPVDSQVKTHLSLLGEAAFFPVQDAKGDEYYTRIGTFNYNATNQIENHFGMKLLYVPAVDGVLPAAPGGGLSVLDCSNLTSNAEQTSMITFRCGISGDVGSSMTRAITVYDNQGTSRTLNYVFTRNADVGGNQSWNLKLQAPNGSAVVGDYNAASPVTILFNADGTPASFNGNATPSDLSVTCPDGASIHATINLGTVNGSDGVIRINGGQSRLQVQVNGHTSGIFKFLETTEDGYIYANYDNNQREFIGRLAVGIFNNPDGLEMLDRGLFLASPRSGTATAKYIGETPAGKVAVGALESSTIETIPQMAKMIERQHQFNNLTSTYGTVKSMLDKISNLRNA